MGVELQMGGADQFGNITAGLELIRRTAARAGGSASSEGGEPDAYALAYPLLLAPSGAKFGKSEGGDSIWLNADGTSPFAFYQYWLNTDDRDVPVYLRWFTTMPPDEIESLEASMRAHPELREAQRALALDVTARVHGEATARAVVDASVALFDPAPMRDPERLASLHAIVGGFAVEAPADAPAAAVLADAGLLPSRGEARRLIAGGGVTVIGERLTDPMAPLPPAIGDGWYEVRLGKRRREIGRRSG
jgi:tyrosyl-tRNA synthetase